MIPFHKQTDASKQAGQRVFPIPNKELTLSDYIAKKEDNPKRLTFEEWWGTMKYPNPPTYYSWAQQIWNAALKQGKL